MGSLGIIVRHEFRGQGTVIELPMGEVQEGVAVYAAAPGDCSGADTLLEHGPTFQQDGAALDGVDTRNHSPDRPCSREASVLLQGQLEATWSKLGGLGECVSSFEGAVCESTGVTPRVKSRAQDQAS